MEIPVFLQSQVGFPVAVKNVRFYHRGCLITFWISKSSVSRNFGANNKGNMRISHIKAIIFQGNPE
jgi:hypothetical protein